MAQLLFGTARMQTLLMSFKGCILKRDHTAAVLLEHQVQILLPVARK